MPRRPLRNRRQRRTNRDTHIVRCDARSRLLSALARRCRLVHRDLRRRGSGPPHEEDGRDNQHRRSYAQSRPAPPSSGRSVPLLGAQVRENALFQSGPRLDGRILCKRCVEFAIEVVVFQSSTSIFLF